jgi:hypothetical protein
MITSLEKLKVMVRALDCLDTMILGAIKSIRESSYNVKDLEISRELKEELISVIKLQETLQ